MKRSNPLMKPYLKWAGGKRQLLPEIRKQLPGSVKDYTYYEPFVGAGAVFFDVQPKKAVINDGNAQLMMTYRVIKDHVEELIRLLRTYKKKDSEAYYYEIRNLDRDTLRFDRLTEVEKAARVIFLNKTCYNGLYRVNSQGLFNVPYGKYKNPAICEDLLLRTISVYLNASDVSIISEDFEDAVSDAGSQALIYFDPPYHSPDKTNFTGYQSDGFGEAEQERLRDVFARMTRQGAKCLLSNADTALIRDLYRGFEISSVQAKRAINSDATGRGLVNEVLIRNWKASDYSAKV
jgi:DNA adenine methylase